MIAQLKSALLGTPEQRAAAQEDIEVRIGPNSLGGYSIYPANAAAVGLFAGTGPLGNFPTAQAAEQRARRDNCWRVTSLVSDEIAYWQNGIPAVHSSHP